MTRERFGAGAGVRKIISGGQTGADRAALDVARECGIEHGGAIPRGRRAEDGRLSAVYRLQELTTSSYPARTEKNVRDSDATVIFSHGQLTGGSLLTREKAQLYNKPWLHVDLCSVTPTQAVDQCREFLHVNGVEILNVAGPRASGDAEIYAAVTAVLRLLLFSQY